jgi:hypothetical protein
MNNNERNGLLEEAKGKLREAVDLIASAVAGTNEQLRAESYIIPHLTSWLSDTTSCSHNSIDDIIKEFPPEADTWMECEDCGESKEDVLIHTDPAPVSGCQVDPPAEAALCETCADRRLHPAEYHNH